MSDKIQIGVNLTRHEYLALTRIANQKTTDPNRPIQAHHLIEFLIRRELTNPKQARGPRVDIDINDVARLHAEGKADWEIANILGCSRTSVRYRRADILHLPSNGAIGRPRTEQP